MIISNDDDKTFFVRQIEAIDIPGFPAEPFKPFKIFLGPNPKGWGPIDSGCPSVCPFVIDSFPGCIFVTDDHRDLEVGSYERYWPVDVPFDSFGQIRSPKMAEFGQNVHK